MRCVSICGAKEYRLYGIANTFRKEEYNIKLRDKVLHVSDSEHTHDIFIFSYGCLVIWGLKQQQEQQILNKIKSFAVEPLLAEKYERFPFKLGETTTIKTHEKLNTNIIILEKDDSQIKLAISLGLAQSTKLTYYEEIVQRTIEQSTTIPGELSEKGKIEIPNKDISKIIGEIFEIRSSINLSSVYLEPEYFLESLNIDNYYQMIKKSFHIPRRVTLLNQKLDVLHELFEMLQSQLENRLGTFFKLLATILVIMQVTIGFFQLLLTS